MLSFGKILMLVLIVAAAWAAVTIYKRAQRQREIREATERRSKPPEMTHIRTAPCPVCGTYVAERSDRCGRSDCPI